MDFQSEPSFRAIIENAWDMFAVLRPDGTVRYASPSTERLLGYTREDMLGTDGLSYVHPDDLPRARAFIERALHKPGRTFLFEHRFRHRDGSWRGFETVVQSLMEHPAVRGVVVHSQDVTERNMLLAELDQARLQVLRMQIQPHFIFNILHSIHTQIAGAPERAEVMLVMLGDLLRLSFQRVQDQEVPLQHELEFVRRYVEIEQIRFSGRVDVTFDVDPAVEHVLVPNLILQPLVENAIRHAFAPRAGGRLLVQATRKGERLRLLVRDDGAGLAQPAETAGTGVGLRTTKNRLQRRYGSGSRFELTTPREGGLQVILELPLEPDENLEE